MQMRSVVRGRHWQVWADHDYHNENDDDNADDDDANDDADAGDDDGDDDDDDDATCVSLSPSRSWGPVASPRSPTPRYLWSAGTPENSSTSFQRRETHFFLAVIENFYPNHLSSKHLKGRFGTVCPPPVTFFFIGNGKTGYLNRA